MQLKFNKIYFTLFAILLFTEVLIGIYLHDAVIRPYGGDFLVVILLYCLVKSCLDAPVGSTACFVLLFSYAIEISQYFHLTRLLGWQKSTIADLLLGHFFSMTDMLMYTLGILSVIVVERIRNNLKMSFY